MKKIYSHIPVFRYLIGITLFVGVCFFASAQSSGLEVSGFVDTFHSFQMFKPAIVEYGGDPDNTDRQLLDSRARVRMELEAYQDDCDVFISGDASYDGACDSRSGFALKEAYFDWLGNVFGLRVGRQIIVWGKADGVQITDIVCPLDNTTLAGADITDQRLPVNAVTFNIHTQLFSTDVIVIPVFTPAKLPWKEDNPLHKIIFSSVSGGNSMNWIEPESSDVSLKNMELALRVSAWLPYADLAASFFTGNDDSASWTLTKTGSEVEVTGEYKRLYMGGLEAAIPVYDFVFRTEGAFIGNRRFSGKEWKSSGSSYVCSPEKKNQVRVLAGVDWNPASWTITAQYIEDIILDYDEDKVERKQRIPTVTVSIDKSFIHNTVTFSFSGTMDINDFDCALYPAVEYDINDFIKSKVGMDIYTEGKDENSTYGIFKNASCVWIKLVYSY